MEGDEEEEEEEGRCLKFTHAQEDAQYVRGPASCQFMGKCEQSISDVETGTQLSGTEPFGPDCFI